jgi:putative oxidoreductase
MIQALLTRLDRAGDAMLPTLARFAFAAVLLGYFWSSALTKIGEGPLGLFKPALGAYAQIFPRAMDAVSYDVSHLGLWHWAVVTAGTLAEFILPALVVLGLATRLAGLGMIGFVTLQSLTDIVGHGADATAIGAWFDRAPDSPILDQRLLWMGIFVTLVLKGAGPLSLDRLIARRLIGSEM